MNSGQGNRMLDFLMNLVGADGSPLLTSTCERTARKASAAELLLSLWLFVCLFV